MGWFEIKEEKVLKPWGQERWLVSSHIEPITKLQYLNPAKVPYLVKIIETVSELSVQLHPRFQTQTVPSYLPKEECWYILNGGTDAGIYLGLKKNISSHEFFQLAEAKQNVAKFLNFYSAKRDAFFSVPPGVVHAIGKDIQILEVQQASGDTFRIWDWGREGREMHLTQAKEHFQDIPPESLRPSIMPATGEHGIWHGLKEHSDFSVYTLSMQAFGESKTVHLPIPLQQFRPATLVVIQGEPEIEGFQAFPTFGLLGINESTLKVCFQNSFKLVLVV